MKKITLVAFLFINLLNCPQLFSDDIQDEILFANETLSPEIRDAIAQFSLAISYPSSFSLMPAPALFSNDENNKGYWKAAQQIVALNIFVWGYDRYVLKAGWARISLRSILDNLKYGYEWDNNSFQVNQLDHPYHGALYFSAARIGGLSYWESAIYSFLGSFMWEYFLETNRPSANDSIMTTFGGAALGEILFRIADLMDDKSSRGIQRIFRQSLIFIANPIYGFNLFTRKLPGRESPLGEHYYNLYIPFGLYSIFTEKPSFIIAVQLDYQDVFQERTSRIIPYSWFSSDFKFGFNHTGILDKTIVTTGLLTGKREGNSLVGLFGVFDYINTRSSEKMSAVGFGPGFITFCNFNSNLFFRSSEILSMIFGASYSSPDSGYYNPIKQKYYPYVLGPGMLGRVEIEFGKRDFASLQARFNQYWVHSIHSHSNEYLSALSTSLYLELSKRSRISVGYDYYFRPGVHQKTGLSVKRNAIFTAYILKF